jgi:NADPH:quinone reductase-like Zn-dependent oxidoreductase
MTQIEIPTTVQTRTMKAIVREKYGSRGVLKLIEIDKPVVNDDDVLVRVQAAGVNWADWATMRGVPYLFRIMFGGLRRPQDRHSGYGCRANRGGGWHERTPVASR